MSIPQPNRLVEVVSYDDTWPLKYVQEAKAIKIALGNNCIELHHIGSTSVPGLAAKPIIDIVPVVQDITKVDDANAAMVALGYKSKGEYGMPFRRYFQKGEDQRTHHAHVFEVGSAEIERHLKFRDWMKNHPEDREAYANLKQDLARQYPYDINAYCLGKDEFIASIDKKAGFNGLRMVKALTAREWSRVQHFRQYYFFDKTGCSDPYTWTFDQDAHVHFVLYQGSEIMGYVHLQLWPHQRAAMRIMVIDELKRNQTSGVHFLRLCERWLKNQGVRSLHIESSPGALKFYRSNGYIDMPFDDPEGYEGPPQDRSIGKIL